MVSLRIKYEPLDSSIPITERGVLFQQYSSIFLRCYGLLFITTSSVQKNIITSTQPTLLPWRFSLYQRPSSEEVCSVRLPVLATTVMRRGKKLVIRVAQHVAPLVPVQGLPSFFSNMYCLFDPSSTFVGFSVQNSGGRPIDHVAVMRCMVSQCWFVLLRQTVTWCTLVSGESFASYGFHLCLVFLQSSTKFPSSLSYVTFLTACTWYFVDAICNFSFSCLSFGCTSSDFKVFTGLIATGTWCFLITRAILSDVPST